MCAVSQPKQGQVQKQRHVRSPVGLGRELRTLRAHQRPQLGSLEPELTLSVK